MIIDQSECLVCFFFLHWINSSALFSKKTALLLTNQNGDIFSCILLVIKMHQSIPAVPPGICLVFLINGKFLGAGHLSVICPVEALKAEGQCPSPTPLSFWPDVKWRNIFHYTWYGFLFKHLTKNWLIEWNKCGWLWNMTIDAHSKLLMWPC